MTSVRCTFECRMKVLDLSMRDQPERLDLFQPCGAPKRRWLTFTRAMRARGSRPRLDAWLVGIWRSHQPAKCAAGCRQASRLDSDRRCEKADNRGKCISSGKHLRSQSFVSGQSCPLRDGAYRFRGPCPAWCR